jgi:hypothetical protein
MLTVPKAVVDNEYSTFPEGVYLGEFQFIDDSSNGEKGSDNWRFSLKVGFGNLKAANAETPDPGNRPFLSDIVVVWDGNSVVEVETAEELDALPYMAQRGVGYLSQLAVAVGASKRDEDGNVGVDLKPFVDEIRAHKYDGRPVAVKVEHFEFPKGSKKYRDSIGAISPTS